MVEITDSISEDLKGDVVVLRVKGKLDANLSASLEKIAVEYISSGQYKILLDLIAVSYINSSGLRTLISLKKQVRSFSGKLIIFGLNNGVLEVMKICGFDHVLDISKTEDEALKQF